MIPTLDKTRNRGCGTGPRAVLPRAPPAIPAGLPWLSRPRPPRPARAACLAEGEGLFDPQSCELAARRNPIRIVSLGALLISPAKPARHPGQVKGESHCLVYSVTEGYRYESRRIGQNCRPGMEIPTPNVAAVGVDKNYPTSYAFQSRQLRCASSIATSTFPASWGRRRFSCGRTWVYMAGRDETNLA